MKTPYLPRYRVRDFGFGVEITRIADARTAWLQGEDYNSLFDDLDRVEIAWCGLGFKCLAEAADRILEAFDDMMV